MQAYEQLIPAGDMPNYFVYFTLDPSSIDVNIHPTKTEIKFENEQPIWQILMAATREALAKSSAIPTIDFDVEDAIDIPVYNPVKKSEPSTYKAPKVQVDSSYNPFDTTSYKNRNSIGLNYIKGLRTTEWLSNGSPRLSRMPDRGIAGRGFGSGKTVYGGKQSLLSI